MGAGFEDRVSSWLLDRLPAEFRTSPVRHQPLVLAMAARLQAEATMQSARDVYRNVRAELRDYLQGREIDQALSSLEALSASFDRTRREVALVEQALRGHVWRPRL